MRIKPDMGIWYTERMDDWEVKMETIWKQICEIYKLCEKYVRQGIMRDT